MTAQESIPSGGTETYRSLCKLPVFRPVALKLLKTLAVGDPEVREITALLAADPGLSAEVMTMANSAMFGCTVPIRTIGRAVPVLGLERMKGIALTVAMQSFTRQLQDSEESRSAWRHSLAVAFVAEELAKPYAHTPEAGYTAGLMHDLGRFGLMAAYPCVSARAFSPVYDSGAQVLEEEQRLFGMDHCQAGACLMQVWGLPEEFQAITGRHHDEAAAGEVSTVGLVRAACLAADALGYEAVHKSALPALEEIAAGLSECPARVLAADGAGLRERVEERFASLDSTLRP